MIKKIASRIMPGLLGWVPRHLKALYPFYLAGNLNILKEERFFENLPEAFDGFRIAYASDIHYGPLLKEAEANKIINSLLSLKADLTILGGDYGDVLENSIRFIAFFPDAPQGRIAAVLGNHDCGAKGASRQPLLDAMRNKGMEPLVNQTMVLARAGKTLAICGPDDIKCGVPDLQALKKQSEHSDFVLFIPHSPDLIPDADDAGFRFDLALCGHTHGGQIVLFRRSLHSSSAYGDRYRSGWYRENGADILVSEGVGTSILPMRLGTKAQIHLLTLRAKPQG